MMYRALIVAVIDDYHYRIRIPELNKIKEAMGATPDSELYIATACVNSGLKPVFKVNDAVFVTFESFVSGAPVIQGLIYNTKSQNTSVSATLSDLIVQVNAKLPKDTIIGEVKSDNIRCLKGLYENVQDKFVSLEAKSASNESSLSAANTKIVELLESYSSLKENFDSANTTLTDHVSNDTIHVTAADKENWNNKASTTHMHTVLEKVEKLTLTTALYGTAEPTGSAEEGQIYFKLEE